MTNAESPPPTFGARLRRLVARENLPRSRAARICLGTALVLGGAVGFLPILGFWMLPMGLAILAMDIPSVRRFTRKVTVAVSRLFGERKSKAPGP